MQTRTRPLCIPTAWCTWRRPWKVKHACWNQQPTCNPFGRTGYRRVRLFKTSFKINCVHTVVSLIKYSTSGGINMRSSCYRLSRGQDTSELHAEPVYAKGRGTPPSRVIRTTGCCRHVCTRAHLERRWRRWCTQCCIPRV